MGVVALNVKRKIVIVEGSQAPPTFVRNLIEGLLGKGLQVCLMGKQKANPFKPTLNLHLFSRIETDYLHFSVLKVAIEFVKLFFESPSLLHRAKGLTHRSQSTFLNLKRWIGLTKLLKEEPDIIHIQWAAHVVEYASLIELGELNFVLSLRGRHVNVVPVVDKRISGLYQRLFPKISGFHAVSKAMARTALRYGARKEALHVIYSPIPDQFLSSYSVYTKKRQQLKIISIGRFHWQKGYSHALDAMKILSDKGIDFKYTIIAPGQVPEEIYYQLADLDLTPFVEIKDGLPYNAIAEELKSYSVFLLPSLEEGIANVVLEAMAVGLPVISTDCGGMREVVITNETGFLIPVRDPASIAESLIAFTKLDVTVIQQISKQANALVKKQFNYEQNIGEFQALYQNVIAENA